MKNIQQFWFACAHCEAGVNSGKQHLQTLFHQCQTAQFFLFNHLFKDLLTKPYLLSRFQFSNLLQNITSAVQFQQDTLQLCKFEIEKDELFINYFQQLESISFTKLKRICKLTPFLNSFYSLVNKKSLTQSCSLYRYLSICWQ